MTPVSPSVESPRPAPAATDAPAATVTPVASFAAMTPRARTCRALARLLDYPGEELLASAPALLVVLQAQGYLSAARLADLERLAQELQSADRFEVQARYVSTFDRGRATSLHLFEHVHGDSRERGPALVDLARTYEEAGLFFDAAELPDHLPAVLEFASTQPDATARVFLAEMAHILAAIQQALVRREEPGYAAVLSAVLDLADAGPQAVRPPVADEPLDLTWAEPAAFDGCTSAGQQRPGSPQPIHVVRKPAPPEGARP